MVEMLGFLACPISKQSLTLVSNDFIINLNKSISKGEVKNVGGNIIQEEINGGLMRKDETLIYPIINNIPVLLADEAISIYNNFKTHH